MSRSYTVWVLAGLVVASALWAIWPREDLTQIVPIQNVQQPGDSDSAAEEVLAVATRITEVEQKINDSTAASRAQSEQLRLEFNTNLAELQSFIATLVSENEVPDVLQELSDRISAIELNAEAGAVTVDYEVFPGSTTQPVSMIEWIEPIKPPGVLGGEISVLPGVVSDDLVSLNPHPPEPALTIPVATIVEATALTALVGRLPVDGQIESPLRFKLISKAANFTSRNQSIPGLAGVIWTGVAYGDLTLSCVSGTLDSITYVFADGTVNTRQSEKDPADITRGLGWISDARGNPCIPGSLKTNAPAVIARSLVTSTLAGVARGYAEAQTERQVDSDGASITTVTGDGDDYALAQAAADAVSEVDVWIRRRIEQSFDAIFVPAGESLFIHIEQQINFDYDPDGRRLAHRHLTEFEEARIALGGHD